MSSSLSKPTKSKPENNFNPFPITNTNIYPKKTFVPIDVISKENTLKCLDFAYQMAFSEHGHHRDHRSGGSNKRSRNQIFINTLQGKLAEFAFYEHAKKQKIPLETPDLTIGGVNVWDNGDFEINKQIVSIKSSSFYSNLLLLETQDYDKLGREVTHNPPLEIGLFVFIRMAVSINGTIMPLERKFKQTLQNKENLDNFKEDVVGFLKYEISGFMNHDDFLKIIQENYVLKKGQLLNEKMKLDANNYYVPIKYLRPHLYIKESLGLESNITSNQETKSKKKNNIKV
jgi:hypothetical protein